MIFGQDSAIDEVASAIKLSRSGLRSPEKPIGNFLFAGPTGVGKTELARQLARILGVEFLRFDMSEYMEKHAVSRLIGAPPGYVGYEEGGLLIDAVRKSPHAVLLLDEIEKAHPDMFSILLQVMDHATLTDSHGRKADFRHVILIMTTNAGARDLSDRRMGFGEAGTGTSSRGALERTFTPEFRNRLDAIVTFNPLGTAEIERVVDKQIDELRAMVAATKRHHRADASGTGLAGGQGLRPRLRRAADGPAHRARHQEAAVRGAAVRQPGGRRHRYAWTWRTMTSACTPSRTVGAPWGRHEPRRHPPRLSRRAAQRTSTRRRSRSISSCAGSSRRANSKTEPTAMTLATATREGRPSARTVLLKGVDAQGFVFYTNYESRKARELAETGRASLLFFWRSLERQVRIDGPVAQVSGRRVGRLLRDASGRKPLECLRLAAESRHREPRRARRALRRRAAPSSATASRAPRGGAATASCPRSSSSGRGARAGCTIVCATYAPRPAGGVSGWRRRRR